MQGGSLVAIDTTQEATGMRQRAYTRAMSPGRKRDRGSGGRYDEREIAARVEKRRKAKRMEVKALCAELGIEKWDWSRKVRLDRSAFTIAELGKIADILEAPPGWPFVAEEVGELLERVRPPNNRDRDR